MDTNQIYTTSYTFRSDRSENRNDTGSKIWDSYSGKFSISQIQQNVIERIERLGYTQNKSGWKMTEYVNALQYAADRDGVTIIVRITQSSVIETL